MKRARGPASSSSAGYAVAAERQGFSFPSRRARLPLARSMGEPGFVDVAGAGYAMDTTGSVTLLNTIPQGAGSSERIGKRVALKSLQCRGTVYANAAVTLVDVAFMIVYDKRPTGALPAITDVLLTATPASMNNDVNSGRFRILKRVDHVLIGSAANNYTACSAFNNDWYLDLRGLPQVFKAAGTGAIADIEEGALYLITVGANAAGTTAGALSAAFRVRYYDV